MLRHTERFESRDDTAEYRFAGTYSFARGIFTRPPVPGSSFRLGKVQRVRAGDFVYCKIMAWEGAFGLVPTDADNHVMSGAFVVYEPRLDKVVPAFLDWYFKVPHIWREIGSPSTGTNIRRRSLHPAQFEKSQIPLPPLPEQRRIVARIEEQADRITEASGMSAQASASAGAFMSAAIEGSLSLAARNPRTHEMSLDDACALVTDGAHHTPVSLDAGVPLLMATNVCDDHLDTTNVRFISRADHEVIHKRAPVEKGDVLFINIGATTGTTTKVDTDLEFSIKNVALIKPDREQLDADYLVFFLRSPTVKNMIAERQAQTCQQFLSLRELRNLRFPVPILQEQRRIVTELDALQAKVDELKRLQAETQAELDALMPSILDRAFKGEL